MEKNKKLKVISEYKPSGDQPEAIEKLCAGLKNKTFNQVLLGVTGSGKTYTMAKTIEKLQRPALILAPNKTLAGQLFQEMKELFPNNAVEYFVSYYDYYQPEAYVAKTNTYIEKDASINEQIDRMRHSTTRSLFERKDVVIVASVSCIYGIGPVETYSQMTLSLKVGINIDRTEILQTLVSLHYKRNDHNFVRGNFRVRGDIIEIFPSHLEDKAWKIDLFGDEIEKIIEFDPLTGQKIKNLSEIKIYSNSHYIAEKPTINQAIKEIKKDLTKRIVEFKKNNKLIEAQRIEERTNFDLEMIEISGTCSGIENYSRYITGRQPGKAPPTLFEYLPNDTILFVDESHVTVPQLNGMYKGDFSRKSNLSEFGFRLPSCVDNRPLKFDEWNTMRPETIFVSATPSDWEMQQTHGEFVEQIIRPTGVLDPIIEVRGSENQIDDLIEEILKRVEQDERVLVTTLTKRMAEELTKYLHKSKIRANYVHSDIDTLERVEIMQNLRKGIFDVLVGVNLLREGLDLPEVSLVAILDADKEGFLRAERSLIQTIGRAARHVEGVALLYADNFTDSMKRAISETERRRTIQKKYNQVNGITPKPAGKKIENSILSFLELSRKLDAGGLSKDLINIVNNKTDAILSSSDNQCLLEELPDLIEKLEIKMKDAAKELNFEEAANLRDRIKKLRQKLARNN